MADILYQRYNVDGVFNRSVIAGLLYLLNHKITYQQVWEDKVVENVTVPFAYNFAHAKDQRFAQDNYTFFGRECFSDKLIDGKFDMLPRFAVSYTGSNIDSNNITNRFVKGEFMKDENGTLTTYTAFMYSIPITMNFDIEGWIDNYDTAFKIEQELRNTFYKNQTFNVLYKGIKIGCCAGFPETETIGEKTISYSFEQENQLKMNFSLAVECYQPCFDESLAIKSENRIENIVMDVEHFDNPRSAERKNRSIKFNPIDTGIKHAPGEELKLSWSFDSDTAEGLPVILYYKDKEGNKTNIDILNSATEYYWKIPSSLSKIKQPDVFFFDNDYVSVEEDPEIFVSPNSQGYVDDEEFTIVNGGKFKGTGLIQVSLEYIDKKRKVQSHDCYVAAVSEDGIESIQYYSDFSEEELLKYNIKPVNTKKMKYVSGSINKITIGISYPFDSSIYDEIDNVLIF